MERDKAIFAAEIPIGPFADPPFELGRCVTAGFAALKSDEITATTTQWLLRRLEQLGVGLGEHDREIAAELAEDVGWDAVQVVAGWVARSTS